MKPLLSLLLFVLFPFCSNAQIVDIPNTDFKDRLLFASEGNSIAKNLSGNYFKIDANNDGEIQVSEALNVSYLNLQFILGENLSGIEAFTNLIELYIDDAIDLVVLNLDQNINLEILEIQMVMDLVVLSINGCVNLQSLIIDENLALTSIDVSENTNLQTLYLNSVILLNSLDVTQNISLQTLYVSDSVHLESIDVTQNVSIETLIILGTNINNLDLSQNLLLKNLNCAYNNLTNLDVSQNILLESINCEGNDSGGAQGLTNLDFSQNINLQDIVISNFYLETLNVKNGTSEQITLEWHSYYLNICADEDDIPYILALEFLQEASVVSSYCDFIPGGYNNRITGEVFFDSNNDGCDINDLPVLNNIRIDLGGDEQASSYAYGSGIYNFYTQEGDYTLIPNVENPDWYNISPTSVDIQFLDNYDNETIQDFCITSNGVHNDVEIVINSIIPARPGFDAYYQIVYNNKGNQVLTGDINFMFDDAVMDYISASINPDNQTVGNLTWNYSDLRPLESKSFLIVLNVNSPMETPAVNIGDQLDFLATINPTSSDETPNDNEFSYKQTVIGSYDPNDITCLEGDIVSPDNIGEYLHYNINFENTGTAAATFVVVKDVIDETSFDLSSLQIMYASHEMQTRVVDNTIELIFDNINLQPEGKGNVVFKIKTNNTLTVGDSVENDAEIFFDYNFPIETNIATTNFQVLSVDEFGIDTTISVFPNPSKDRIKLTSKSNLKSIKVYDAMSRLVFETPLDDSNYTLNVSSYSKGIYFLKLKTASGEQVERFIKN